MVEMRGVEPLSKIYSQLKSTVYLLFYPLNSSKIIKSNKNCYFRQEFLIFYSKKLEKYLAKNY